MGGENLNHGLGSIPIIAVLNEINPGQILSEPVLMIGGVLPLIWYGRLLLALLQYWFCISLLPTS